MIQLKREELAELDLVSQMAVLYVVT